MRRLILLLTLLSVMVAAGCQSNSASDPTATAVEKAAVVLELVGLDGASKALTLEDLKALPAHEGWGGSMSSTGRITPPAQFKSVTVQDLCDLVGGLQPGTAARIVAKDGYAMTISYDQVVNGDFIAYDPGTSKETNVNDQLRVVIAYEKDGAPLPEKEDGILRMALLNNEKTQVTDGHWWVKWVSQIEIKSMAAEWDLHLEGALVEDVDRNSYESCGSPSCHQATWTDDHAQPWAGVPLWLLVGRVDDQIPHEGKSFDRSLADAGYTVEVVAADGYAVSLDSQRIKENNDIIVANTVNENPLEEKHFPLRLVGADLEKNEQIGQIAQIIVHLSEDAGPEPAPTEELEALVTPPPGDGALSVFGAVAKPTTWTWAELQSLDVEEISGEHPKKGAQTNTGVRLNALLELVEPAPEATVLTLTAVDGYSAEMSLADVYACADCMVAFTNSDTLKATMYGFDDSSVWVKDLVQIEIK